MEIQQPAHDLTTPCKRKTSYCIEVSGRLQKDWSEFFSGTKIEELMRTDKSVISRITGNVQDPTEMAGILNALTDLDLPIVSVNTFDAGDSRF